LQLSPRIPIGKPAALRLFDLCRYSYDLPTSCLPSSALVLSMAITWARLQITLIAQLCVSCSSLIDFWMSMILPALCVSSQLFSKPGSPPSTTFQLPAPALFLLHLSRSRCSLLDDWASLLLLFRLDTICSRNGNTDQLPVACIIFCASSGSVLGQSKSTPGSVCLWLWVLLSFRTICCFGLQSQTTVASCAKSLYTLCLNYQHADVSRFRIVPSCR